MNRHTITIKSAPLATLAGALAIAGCGGAAKGEPRTDAPAPLRSSLPTVPTVDDKECAAGVLATNAAPDRSLIPEPGQYRYALKGTRTLLGPKRAVKALPREASAFITPARRIGNLRCFRLMIRLAPNLEDTATFVVRGSDLYVAGLRLRQGGQLIDARPEPPSLGFDARELEWEGTYTGATSGRYALEVVGRRDVRVRGRSIETVGLDARVSYRGEIEGTERALRWFAPRGGLLVRAKISQERFVGLDRARLDYRLRLKSLDPEPVER